MTATVTLDGSDAIQVDDGRTVHAQKSTVEACLHGGQAVAQLDATSTRVDSHPVVGGLDPVDLGGVEEYGASRRSQR